MQLNEWLFPLKAFREMQGEGGEVNASTPIVSARHPTRPRRLRRRRPVSDER